ncbi:biliverdin-producing heme oxygenase [Rhizosphaericola mali]|uniref:Biliverdin-producing heme oxygenase n=1 Tax=Rhizosphaericola mali TaxID=2545455 RepID=A0A5P2FVV8_9BACT|nr:biliverdin-producing heme oxygenase [Rhizosphaericola mali]QES87646.1 biliverdin-producing heme oxygenase [Rhizosphaericola mali]
MTHKILKENTVVAHQELEKLIVANLKEIRNTKDYVNFLKLFYSFFVGLESAIEPYITSDILPDYANRRHVDCLMNDLTSLGANIEDLQLVSFDSIIDDKIKALAALYVIEGSIMGGPIILKLLSKKGITQGGSFFAGYGLDNLSKWTSFLTVLDLHIKGDDQNVAVEIANQVFTSFAIWVIYNTKDRVEN